MFRYLSFFFWSFGVRRGSWRRPGPQEHRKDGGTCWAPWASCSLDAPGGRAEVLRGLWLRCLCYLWAFRLWVFLFPQEFEKLTWVDWVWLRNRTASGDGLGPAWKSDRVGRRAGSDLGWAVIQLLISRLTLPKIFLNYSGHSREFLTIYAAS